MKVVNAEDFVKHGSIETKKRMVLEVLKENHCLIIVDNLETIDDENLKSFLIDINFPIESKVLITSRKRLGQVEYVVYLDKFTLPETKQYILSQLKHRQYEGSCSDELINDINLKTGGVPLAIKVIIPWIIEGKIHSQFVGDIDKDTDILKFCFEKVYQEFLDGNAKKLFCILSLAPTEISETALKFISELSENEFNKCLNSLINYSLIFKSKEDSELEKIFSMLPLTQQFGKKISENEYPDLKVSINKSYLRYIELSQSEEHSANRAIAINKAEEAGRLFSRGSIEEAEKFFKESIEYDKDCDYALYLFAIFSKERQDFGRGESLILRAIKIEKSNTYYWNEYASILDASGDFKKAERILEDSLKQTDNSKILVQKLCLIKTKLQKNKDVIDIVKKTIDYENPDKKTKFINTLLTISLLEAYWRIGSNHYKNSKYDKAQNSFSEAISFLDMVTQKWVISPTNSKILWEEKKTYNRLGEIAKRNHEYHEAKEYFEKALYKTANFRDRIDHNKSVSKKIENLPI